MAVQKEAQREIGKGKAGGGQTPNPINHVTGHVTKPYQGFLSLGLSTAQWDGQYVLFPFLR